MTTIKKIKCETKNHVDIELAQWMTYMWLKPVERLTDVANELLFVTRECMLEEKYLPWSSPDMCILFEDMIDLICRVFQGKNVTIEKLGKGQDFLFSILEKGETLLNKNIYGKFPFENLCNRSRTMRYPWFMVYLPLFIKTDVLLKKAPGFFREYAETMAARDIYLDFVEGFNVFARQFISVSDKCLDIYLYDIEYKDHLSNYLSYRLLVLSRKLSLKTPFHKNIFPKDIFFKVLYYCDFEQFIPKNKWLPL